MRRETSKILEDLRSTNWFTRVGQSNAESISVSSWGEAIERAELPSWEDIRLEAQNEISSFLVKTDRERRQQWNIVVRTIKQLSIPLVTTKIERVVKTNQLPASFISNVQRDIMYVAMGVEYSDVFEQGLFSQILRWYLQGHFPCGWEGKYPEGKMIVF